VSEPALNWLHCPAEKAASASFANTRYSVYADQGRCAAGPSGLQARYRLSRRPARQQRSTEGRETTRYTGPLASALSRPCRGQRAEFKVLQPRGWPSWRCSFSWRSVPFNREILLNRPRCPPTRSSPGSRDSSSNKREHASIESTDEEAKSARRSTCSRPAHEGG